MAKASCSARGGKPGGKPGGKKTETTFIPMIDHFVAFVIEYSCDFLFLRVDSISGFARASA